MYIYVHNYDYIRMYKYICTYAVFPKGGGVYQGYMMLLKSVEAL